MVRLPHPVLTNTQLDILCNIRYKGFNTVKLPIVFEACKGKTGLQEALSQLCKQAEQSVSDGVNYIILSDRSVDATHAAIPSLLAVSAVHHHLIAVQKRVQTALIVESGEIREVMHAALLLGYGASAINPYMAFAVLDDLVKKGEVQMNYDTAEKNCIKAICKGLFKIMSKMGISTIRSYRGAKIFEAVGVSEELLQSYFGTSHSSIGGIRLEEVARDAIARHDAGFLPPLVDDILPHHGLFSFRKDGEWHAWNPETISTLQLATRLGSYKKFKEFTALADAKESPIFLRDFFRYKENPIPIEQVEPVENIVKHFVTGAMSFGAISKEAHEALALAMNKLGARSNTGEGGEDSDRISGTHDGISLISPPPHHDIYSIEDLAQLIFDLKNVNPHARISVKLVAESGVGTIAAGVAKAKADLIVISGAEGGTGASPASSMRYAGISPEIGLSETQQTLVLNGLRGQVRLQVDGQLKTGRDVISMALLGAEEFGFGTAALIVLGCVMMRKCHTNTCPVGVATQDPMLRERFRGHYEYVANYFTFLAQEVREYLARMGFRRLEDVIGRTDLIGIRQPSPEKKTSLLDFSKLLHKVDNGAAIHNTTEQKHDIAQVKDRTMIAAARDAIEHGKEVSLEYTIANTDRSVGAMLSGAVAKKYAWWPQLHSFAVELKGAPDLVKAREVAEFIGTVHHEINYTIQEGLYAIRDVIYYIETYDVTTVRASTPMYLLAHVIKSMGIKMVLSGEGADEIFGGYLYFHKAPTARAFHEETVRKLGKLHLYDCLRANKSLAAWGVEGRVPFLDKEFLDIAMRLNPEAKMCPGNTIEKKIVREAFADMLPASVAWRQKEQFSDGVGYSWIDTLKALTAEAVSDEQMAQAARRFPINTPMNKEEYYYRSIFEEHFPSESAARSVPSVPSVACSTAEALAWDATFKNLNEPSGRAVKGVHEEAYS